MHRTASSSRKSTPTDCCYGRIGAPGAAVAAALMIWALAGCKREAATPLPPPATVAGAGGSAEASGVAEAAAALPPDTLASSGIVESNSAFTILRDIILPRPAEENPMAQLDFYDSLSMSLDAAEPLADSGAVPQSPYWEPTPDNILTTGTYHGSEVPEDTGQHEWLGAFIDSGVCRFQPTRIEVRLVEDPAGGSGGENPTGKEVVAEGEGTPAFLARDIAELGPGACEAMDLTGKPFPAGSRLAFRYRDVEYVLAAAAHKSSQFPSPDGYPRQIFRLLLTRKAPSGDTTAGILRIIGGEGIGILRLGDFDRDGLPDLLLEDAAEYNTGSTSLYLSRPAAPGRMLKRVGSFVITGC